VVVIGLDSADAALIEGWCAAGQLPVLGSLMADGLWSRVGTTADVMHVSAWPTMYTGTRPGHHGMYHAYQIRAGEQEVHRTRADECGRPPFWKLLDDAGVPCIVLDAFMSHPIAGFDGTQVLEYGTWTWFDEPGATPTGLWQELVRRFGAYPAPEHTKVHGQPDPRRFRDQLIAAAEVKGRISRWLLEERPWEMLFVSFGEPHPAGHYLWHVQDPDYPTYPAGGLAGLGDAVLDVYRAVDSAIGRILEGLGDSDTVIVTSGDGMGPNYAGCHLVPEVLHRLDLYHGADVGRSSASEDRPRRSLVPYLRSLLPPGLRRAVSRCLPPGLQHSLSMKWANADIDWEQTQAFCIPNANEAFVRVNLDGREPRGRVSPGEAYARLIEHLEERLGELINPENGRRAPARVLNVDPIFPGDRRQDLPDVVVTWDEEARVLADLESPACGRVSLVAGHETAPYYTGNHRPFAFVLARGPGIEAGRSLDGGHIVDIAPTILAMLGVEPPAYMEGRVWAGFGEG